MDKSKKTRNNKNNKGVIILVVVVVIIILVCVFAKLNKNKKNTDNVGEKQEIDYNFINEMSNTKNDANIVMENSTNAEVKDSVKRNISEKLKETKTFNGINVTNARIELASGICQFMADVENPYEKYIEGKMVKVVFLNKDGSKITTIETYFPDMEPNSQMSFDLTSEVDITEAYDFRIEE